MSSAGADEGRFLPGRHLLDAYGNHGFRFGGMSHRGSILALPSGVRAWHVTAIAELDAHSLADVLAEASAIELMLFGTGTELVPLPASLRALLREHGMAVDVMPTSAAARTYNVLVAEERKIGAGLIAVE
ncbi:Mth938-like domain-containing protein [Chelatococcus reniformis]|uniref:Membrane protein n=1 Tax=Chelatococcus reniformis TaxID=1494448 RepID=A0A916X934_9HYPH|nr:MTH938/NDUFAF3 family protein [Chelatococcus reniformis]GGC55861.1 membrane protein [Chelatococcus reniformis]